MKYDYLFLGVQRTGTSAIWDILKLHTQLKAGRIKEISHAFLPDKPLNSWHITESFVPKKHTKVFLEGTPTLVLNSNYINGLKAHKNIGEIKCIFTLRNPLSRMYSNVMYQAKRYYKFGDNLGENFLDENGIIEPILTELVYDQFYNYDLLKGIENTLIIKMEDLTPSTKMICDFVGITAIDKDIPNTNKGKNFMMPFNMILTYHKINDWLFKRKQQFLDMMNDDYEQMKKLYGVTFNERDLPHGFDI
jgi:hypothetical protein